MGLADRDYMRAAQPQKGKVTRLSALPVADFEWNQRTGRFSRPRGYSLRRRTLKRVVWCSLSLAVFTGGWAIACGIIGAQYSNNGKTFEPPVRQPETSHAGR